MLFKSGEKACIVEELFLLEFVVLPHLPPVFVPYLPQEELPLLKLDELLLEC